MNKHSDDGIRKPEAGGPISGTTLAGEAKAHIADAVRNTANEARDDENVVRNASSDETLTGPIGKLRAQIESLLPDDLAPTVASATEAAKSYGREATSKVAGQVHRAATTAQEHPLLTGVIIAAVGFALGRLTAPSPGSQSMYRRWR